MTISREKDKAKLTAHKTNRRVNPKANPKVKAHAGKKSSAFEIPASKVAKGRRPHQDEGASELYQPSLLEAADLNATGLEKNSASAEGLSREVPDAGESSKLSGTQAEASFKRGEKTTETILEGEPPPRASQRTSQRAKVDLKNHIENVKGVIEMGTAIVKSSFPKPFEVAERVVDDWKKDGDFSELPINQPLLQFYVGLGLRKAKQTEREIEQKLETAGVLPVFRHQWQKAQKFFK